ncbi:MAG: TonB-dependent receptor [Bacteroidales bacterium]|nr:TonB-dependent receptor [Bacteroidales bacterium]
MAFTKKIKVLLLIISLPMLFSVQLSFSQSNFKGKVIDAQTGETIAGAKVQLKTYNRVTLTNDSGLFTISIPSLERVILEISMLGYNSITDTFIFSSSHEKTYKLTPSVEDIDAVVITANRMMQPIKNTTVLTQLVPAEQQLRMGNYNITSVLEREIAGLEKANFGYRPKLTYQGLGARYMLFLVDGERMAGEMDGDIDYYRLNMDNIDRIEILRGPASVIYGSNAISGVINLITRKPQSGFEAGSSLRYSKYNETNFNLYAGGARNKISYLSSITTNHTDGYDLTPNEPYSKNQEKYSNYAFNQRFDYNFSKQTSLTIKGNIFYNRIYDGIVDVRAVDHGYAGQSSLVKIEHKQNDSAQMVFSYAIDRFVNYNILINRNDNHSKTASDVLHTLRWMTDRVNSLGHWTGGSEFVYENLFSEKLSIPYVHMYTLIAFLQNDYRISKKISVVSGSRAIYYSTGKYSIVPALSIVLRFEPVILRTSYGQGFRSPTLKEMYYQFDHQGMFYLIGNRNLESERSNYVSTSVELRKNNFSFAANAYYNQLTDMIYHTLVAERTFQYININKARVMGVDWISKWKPLRDLIFSLNMSYINSINLSTDSAMYNVAPFSAAGSITYNLKIKKNWQITLDLSDRYTAARTYEPVGEIIYHDPAFHYWKFTSMLRYKTLSFTLGIDNLFNNVMPYSLGNISPGRRMFIVLSYQIHKY